MGFIRDHYCYPCQRASRVVTTGMCELALHVTPNVLRSEPDCTTKGRHKNKNINGKTLKKVSTGITIRRKKHEQAHFHPLVLGCQNLHYGINIYTVHTSPPNILQWAKTTKMRRRILGIIVSSSPLQNANTTKPDRVGDLQHHIRVTRSQNTGFRHSLSPIPQSPTR